MDDSPFSHLIFCPSLRIVYAPVPKAACSSVKTYLRRQMGLPDVSLARLHNRSVNGFTYAAQMPTEEVVPRTRLAARALLPLHRLPEPVHSRLVSAYRAFVEPADTRLPDSVDALRSALCKATNARWSETIPLTFATFVRALAAMRPADFNRHWQRQHTLVCGDLFHFDLIIKMEDLGAKAADAARAMGLTEPIADVVNASDIPVDTRQYITPEVKTIIQRIYARDFRKFGYDPEAVPDAREAPIPTANGEGAGILSPPEREHPDAGGILGDHQSVST